VIRTVAFVALAIVVAAPAIAYADTRAEAILLFDQGQQEMKAGNLEKACASFEKSNALYPDSGTKGSLARCYEKLGKLGSSWLLWRELADTAPTPDLRRDAGKQAARLDPKVPKYVVKVAVEPPGLVVAINGRPVSVTGLPVPIDAGPVVATATAPNHESWRAELVAENARTLTIEVPTLVAKQQQIDRRDDRQDDRPDEVIGPPPTPIVVLDTSRRKNRRILAASIAGAGAVAAIAGGAFGLSARGTFDDAKAVCGGAIDACLPDRVAEAQVLVDDARRAANLSTILVAAGGAAIVTGAVLWFTAPGAEQRTIHTSATTASMRTIALSPIASPDAAGFVVSGRF
jgi:hypothetical protein